jgi:hypothetical protein
MFTVKVYPININESIDKIYFIVKVYLMHIYTLMEIYLH